MDRKKTIGKIRQVASLVTCLLMLLSVVILRDGRVLGHRLGGQSTEEMVPDAATTDGGDIVVNTTTMASDITGFGGNVPLEITVHDGVITDIRPLKNAETPEFFERALTLLDQWRGKRVEEAARLQVDAVSGATFSSRAIIGNMQRGLAFIQKQQPAAPAAAPPVFTAKTAVGLLVVLMAALLPLFIKDRRYQLVQSALNVIVLGFWCGAFLSHTVILGFLSGGIDVVAFAIPTVMLVTAFIFPLFGKKNYYCAHVCPFGSLQHLTGRCCHRKWHMTPVTLRRLDRARQWLWAVLMFCLWSGVWSSWTDYEPFSAFIFGSASWAVIAIAVSFAVLSLFIERPYCRFVCPMGTLFKLSQSSK